MGEPSSAPAKIQTSRLPSSPVLNADKEVGGPSQEAHAPKEVVASLHGEAGASKDTGSEEGVEGKQTASQLQPQKSLVQPTEVLRKGQEAGQAGKKNRVVFHSGWLSDGGKLL